MQENTLKTIQNYKTVNRKLTHQLQHSLFFNNNNSNSLNLYHYYFHNQPLQQLHHQHNNIINNIHQLYKITNAGKLILPYNNIIQLLVQLAQQSINHLLEITHSLINSKLLAISPSSPNYLRFPVSPHSQILHYSTSLLTQIIKFSSPQLSKNHVNLIIHLFINKIGLITCYEDHLKIVLDYIDCLITFGYVPTHQSSKTAATLNGNALLIDLVRFVAKVVGLQTQPATVNVVKPLQPKRHSDLIDLSSSGNSYLSLNLSKYHLTKTKQN